MLDSIKEVLITEEALRERVAELGKQISADYKGEDVVLVCVLKGAVVFLPIWREPSKAMWLWISSPVPVTATALKAAV